MELSQEGMYGMVVKIPRLDEESGLGLRHAWPGRVRPSRRAAKLGLDVARWRVGSSCLGLMRGCWAAMAVVVCVGDLGLGLDVFKAMEEGGNAPG